MGFFALPIAIVAHEGGSQRGLKISHWISLFGIIAGLGMYTALVIRDPYENNYMTLLLQNSLKEINLFEN